MAAEYHALGLYPQGHIMASLRPHLDPRIMNSQEILGLDEGAEATVAGLVIRRQRPHAKAVFLSLEDEFGHIPLVVWPQVYQRFRMVIREPVLIIRGVVSRREDTFNIVAQDVQSVEVLAKNLPKAKDWQ
jgi:error-prone DNA polymerase